MSDKEDDAEEVFILHECDDHKVVIREDGQLGSYSRIPEDASPPEGGTVVNFEEVPGNPNLKVMRKKRVTGPAMVNSAQYRSGWDNIFGAKKNPRKRELN